MGLRNTKRALSGALMLVLALLTGCNGIMTAAPGGSVAVQAGRVLAPADAGLGGSTVAPTPTVPAGAILKTEWFNLSREAASHWALEPDPKDPNRFSLSARERDAQNQRPKRVLIAFTKPSLSYDVALSRIAEVFYTKRVPVVFTAANFKNNKEAGLRLLDEAVAEKYDLIISMGSDSTDFLVANFNGRSIPVVTVNSKDPVLLGHMKDYQNGSGSNFAFTSLNVPIELQMTYLRDLKKDLKNIAVMYSEANRSAKETQAEPLKPISRANNIRVIDVSVADDKKAKEELAVKVPAAVAEMAKTDPELKDSIFLITGDTTVFNEIATINQGSKGVPVLSVVPDVVREGDDSAVMSIGVAFDDNAYLAALYAIEVLSGKTKAGALKVGVVSPPDIAINFRKAKQIGLKVPLSFFESASDIYDYEGKPVRLGGQAVHRG